MSDYNINYNNLNLKTNRYCSDNPFGETDKYSFEDSLENQNPNINRQSNINLNPHSNNRGSTISVHDHFDYNNRVSNPNNYDFRILNNNYSTNFENNGTSGFY